jgi:small subunit ribosomal protein S20
MANISSAKKRERQNVKRRAHNRTVRSELRTAIKRYRDAARKGDDNAGELLSAAESKLDKAAKRRIVPPGRADRLKGRMKKILPAKK